MACAIDLTQLLAKFTGAVPGAADAEQLATRLPVDDPGPDVEFAGQLFCLTGRFIFGSRQKCEQVIQARGGTRQAEPNPDTDYLVIGALGSPDWTHSPYGHKVERVLNYRQQGANTSIISEEHWTFFLDPRTAHASST